MSKGEKKIIRELLSATLLLVAAFVIPLLAYFSVWMPEIDNPEIWFQRSGAVAVLLVVMSEYGLWLIGDSVNPSGFIVSSQADLSQKYQNKYKFVKCVGASLAIIGTFVWGYGDLVWIGLNS